MTISALEDQLEAVLRSHGLNDLWQLAANLARKSTRPELLESLFVSLDLDTARAALVRISASLEIAGMLNEIENSTSRISDIGQITREATFFDAEGAQKWAQRTGSQLEQVQ